MSQPSPAVNFRQKQRKQREALRGGPVGVCNKKAGEDLLPLRLARETTGARSVPLQLEDFVFNAEFLTLQVGDRVLIG